MTVAANVATKTRFEVVPLTKHIGAQIRGIDLREKPDDETVRAIYQAWLDHLVLIFPGSEAVAGRLHPRHRLFRRDGRLVAPGQIFSQRLFKAPARHHDDLKHPRERRADRRAAGR